LTDNHEAGAPGAEKSDCFFRLICVIHDASMIRYKALFYKLYGDWEVFISTPKNTKVAPSPCPSLHLLRMVQ
jgi:predicted secreted protein